MNKANIPLILVGNDIESVNRLACVRVNAAAAGRIAAELMNYVTPAGSETVVLLGDKGLLEHREKSQRVSKPDLRTDEGCILHLKLRTNRTWRVLSQKKRSETFLGCAEYMWQQEIRSPCAKCSPNAILRGG